MFSIWWAWRSLHVAERLLLVISLLLIAFCAGASWQIYHQHSSSQTLLQEPLQAELIEWNSNASIIVDVSGKVAHPGIVRLPSDARVQDAIKKAGGVLPGTNASKLNLAASLSDGEQVQVDSTSQESTFSTGISNKIQININQASESDLESLPGIGPVMAERVVAYRKAHGAFQTLDDLDKVKGIGTKTIEKLRPFIIIH
ncbi:MAG: ComEA family DNA-binding protein [Abditibacteriaceae bacterium]